MGYLDTELTEEQRIFLDQLSPSEFDHFCLNYSGDIPRAVLDHYRETFLWWADTIYHPSHGLERVAPPNEIPSRLRLVHSRERGTFLVEGD